MMDDEPTPRPTSALRRTGRILHRTVKVALTIVGLVCLVALIGLQTSWFRGQLRSTIVGFGDRFLNGRLAIGRVSGNLITGIVLHDVSIVLDGQPAIIIPTLTVHYRIASLISAGRIVDEVDVDRPEVYLRHTAAGWNLGHLVKPRPPGPPGSGPTFGIARIVVTGGRLDIEGASDPPGAIHWPHRIDRMDTDVGLLVRPGDVAFDIHRFSGRAVRPGFAIPAASGRFSIQPARFVFGALDVRLATSHFRVDGDLPRGDRPADWNLRVSAAPVDLPEIAGLVPAVRDIRLRPSVDLSARGPASAIGLRVGFQSGAGDVSARLTADLSRPARHLTGDVQLTRLNLAPLIKKPAVQSNITGDVIVDAHLGGGALTAAYRFEGLDATVAGYQGAAIAASGTVDRTGVTLKAGGEAYGGRVAAAGRLAWPSRGQGVGFNLQGTAADVDLSTLPAHLGLTKLDSRLNFDYTLTGNWPRLEGRFALRDSTAIGAAIAGGDTGSFSLAGEHLQYAARGTVAHLDLQRVGRTFGIETLTSDRYRSDLGGTFDLQVTGTTLDTLVLDASGHLRSSHVFEGTVPAAEVEAHLAGRRLTVRTRGGFDGLDLTPAFDTAALRGRISGQVDATAAFTELGAPLTVDTFTWNGALTLDRSTIDRVEIAHGTADLTYAARQAEIRQLSIDGPLGHARASGRLNLAETGPPSSLAVHVHATDLAGLARLTGWPVDGQASIDGSVTGLAGRLVASGQVTAGPAAWAGLQALSATSSLQATLANLDLATLEVTAHATLQAIAEGGHDVAQVAAVDAHYRDDAVQLKTSLETMGSRVEASGDWTIAHGAGTAQRVRLTSLGLYSGALAWTMPAGAAATVTYDGEALAVTGLALARDSHRLTVDGTIGAPGQALHLRLTDFDLASLDTLLPRAPGLTGSLDAAADLTGTLRAPVADVRYSVTGGGFRTLQQMRLTGTARYAAGRVRLDARLEQPDRAWLSLAGSVPAAVVAGDLTSRAPIDVTVQSSPIPLALPAGFTRVVQQVSGTVQADVRLHGSMAEPLADGHVDIRNGRLTVAASGVTYTHLDTTIALAGDRVHVEQLTVLDPRQHPLRIAGDLAITGGRVSGIRVELRADRFELVDSPLATVAATSDLQLTGDLLHPRLEGTVTLNAAAVDADRLLDLVARGSTTAAPLLPAGEAGEAPREGPPAPQPTLFGPLAVDVTLRIPDDLQVTGADLTRTRSPIGVVSLSVLFGGTVRVRKAPAGPLLFAGTMTTVRGSYQFQGRRFDIQRGGQIQFQGQQPVDPALNIQASRTIAGVQTQVSVQGTLRAPRLALSSSPPLDEADILALIVFNQPLNQLGEQQQASLVSRASAIAAGALTSSIAESIGRALNLDLFEIQPSPSTGATAALTVGQQIGTRLFLKVSQSIGRESATQFTIDYLLTDFMRLQSTISQGTLVTSPATLALTQRNGIDLVFFFSY
ncbi:MAG: translocation/assembly module TamB domain-containing protein [Acidobacteriota bacterium]|nr:translocation/assembly module TamB domain-containing protein [Acidobacteriota bacterium]